MSLFIKYKLMIVLVLVLVLVLVFVVGGFDGSGDAGFLL